MRPTLIALIKRQRIDKVAKLNGQTIELLYNYISKNKVRCQYRLYRHIGLNKT